MPSYARVMTDLWRWSGMQEQYREPLHCAQYLAPNGWAVSSGLVALRIC